MSQREEENVDDPSQVTSAASQDYNENVTASSSSGEKGIMKFFSPAISQSQVTATSQQPPRRDESFTSLSDRTLKAEILVSMSAVESNISFNGIERLTKVLKVGINDSKIIEKS